MRSVIRSVQAALATLALLWASSAPASAEVIFQVDVGFRGSLPFCLPGPVAVRIENRSTMPFRGRLELGATHFFSVSGRKVARTVEVSPGAARQVFLLVEGRPSLDLTLSVSSRDRFDGRGQAPGQSEVTREDTRWMEIPLGEVDVIDTERAILVLGPKGRQAAGGMPVYDSQSERWLNEGVDSVAMLSLDAHLAPDSVLAYAGIDQVLWTEPDVSELANPAQLRALLDWVTEGGRLTLLAATRPSLLDAPELKAILPLRGISVERGSYPAPDVDGPELELAGPILTGTAKPGSREMSSRSWININAEAPLPGPIVHRVGAGEVGVARFDPFVYDVGSPEVFADAFDGSCGNQLRYAEDHQRQSGQRTNTFFAGEYDPLGGQTFREVLGNQNALVPSFGLFFVLALGFVILIGPVDYLFLKRRNLLTWSPLTLLGYTVLFSVGSIGATFLLFAPDEEVNRIAFLDFSENVDGEERVSGVLFHGAYSPTSGDFAPRMRGMQTFGYEVPAASHQQSAYDGAQAGSGQLFSGPGMQPLDLQMSFNSLRVAGHLISGPSSGGIVVTRRETEGVDVLEVYNGLGSDLTNAIAVSKNSVVEIGDVPRGETVRLGDIRRPRDTTDLNMPDFPGVRVDGPLNASRARRLMVRSASALLDAEWSRPELIGRGHTVFMAMTDALPFDDGLEDRRSGFQWVVVRKVIEDVGEE